MRWPRPFGPPGNFVRHAISSVAVPFAAIGVDPNPPFTIQYRAMGCLTCHYAHGTNAAATGIAATVARPGQGTVESGGVTGGDDAGGSRLLKMDGRGVCQKCHNK